MHAKVWFPIVLPLVAIGIGVLTFGVGDGSLKAPTNPAAGSVIAETEPGPTMVATLSAGDAETSEASDSGSAATATPRDTSAQLADLAARWTRIEAELSRLRGRVDDLERQSSAPAETSPAPVADRPRARTAAERQAAMEAAGLSPSLAEDIVWRQDRYELDRLELRDQATREGWFGTDRYREELRSMRSDRPDVRGELGDVGYDRYLYLSGQDNRVRVDGVITGSAADEAGLRPGDMIEAYGEERIFTFSELRSATTEGDLDELVPVTVRRDDGSRVQAWVRRGPLGIRMDVTRVDPDA